MREVYWVYQCPDPDCRLIGLLHDYEFTTRSTAPMEGSWVPCPRCDEPMMEVRKAEPEDLENPVRLKRYFQGGVIITRPLGALLNPPATTVNSDATGNLPVKRKVKRSIKALTYELLPADQVAKELGMSVQAVRRLWTDGQLGYVQLNKKQRLSSKEQIEEYLRSKTAVTALPSPTRPSVQVRATQIMTPAKTSIEEVRKSLSSWDESSLPERQADKT